VVRGVHGRDGPSAPDAHALRLLVAEEEEEEEEEEEQYETIYDAWYNRVKGQNPSTFFGIYDVVRWDTVSIAT
jgi:hypothetical protein